MADIEITVTSRLGIAPVVVPVLGRFRLGDEVVFAFGSPFVPVVVPDLVILDQDETVVATIRLSSADGGHTLEGSLLLGGELASGRFSATTLIEGPAGISLLLTQKFDVVAGGDPGSSIVSMYEHESAFGRFVIVQTRAGKLMQGFAPFLHRGTQS